MPGLKRGTRVWLGTLLTLGLAVALVGVLGGWQTSDPRTLPLRQPGDTMKIPGWQIAVHGGTVVNYPQGSDYAREDSEIRIRLDLTSTADETAGYVQSNLMEVRLSDGTVLDYGVAQVAEPWSGEWEPGVELPSVVDFELPGLALDAPAPARVELVLHTLEPARGFLSAEGEMRPGPARWRVPIVLTDERIEVDP